MYRDEMFVLLRLLLTISNWIHSLSQARFLTQILKRIQVRRKIEELKSSLIDCISVLQASKTSLSSATTLIHVQDAIFEEVRRTLRLDGTHQVVLPPRANLALRLRLTRRPETTSPQPGSHVHSKDRDGVS